MAKNQRGVQGIPGPPGPAGSKGDTGKTGLRGAIGKTGLRGARGLIGKTGGKGASGRVGAPGPQGREPVWRRQLLHEVQQQIDRVDHELAVQLTRMAQLQQELDQLRDKVIQLFGAATT